jgi:hypothetical protein
MIMKDEAGLRLAIVLHQQTLISTYEDSCPLKPAKTGEHSLKLTSELESLKRVVRWLFNKCQIGLHKVGNSTERLSGEIERR